jgi:predicted site-specific integrase-resolvase
MSNKSSSRDLPSGFLRVVPWEQWCKSKGISKLTGIRLRQQGKIKVVKLSERRLGVREDDDREFMKNAAAEGAKLGTRGR